MWPALIQKAICNLLGADSYFAGSPRIPVIPRAHGDLINEVAHALATLGVCVVVGPGDGRFIRNETTAAVLDGNYTLTVFENVAVNRSNSGTGQVAECVAWAAAVLLSGIIPKHPDTGADLAGGPFVLQGIADAEVTTEKEGTRLICELTVRISGGAPASERGRLTRQQSLS